MKKMQISKKRWLKLQHNHYGRVIGRKKVSANKVYRYIKYNPEVFYRLPFYDDHLSPVVYDIKERRTVMYIPNNQ